jgi:hypothetical protein
MDTGGGEIGISKDCQSLRFDWMRDAGSWVCSDCQLDLQLQMEAAQDLPTTLDTSALDLSPMDW